MSSRHILALICARGGSKSIPHKNITEVAGKPLIVWTIEAARNCSAFDRVIVSTDDQRIAQVASLWGAEVPFLRPAELARDDTPGIEPVIHAVRWLRKNQDYYPDYVMLLQPTSPLRTEADLEAAIELALERDADSVVSVSPVDQHPYWMKRINDKGQLEDLFPLDSAYVRRQELPAVYALNGAIYLVRCETLVEKRTFYTRDTYAYVMPPERAIDIDSPWSLYLVDLILRDRQVRENG